MSCFVCFLKEKNKKGFVRATLSKMVLLWGFHLVDLFLLGGWLANFVQTLNVLLQTTSCS